MNLTTEEVNALCNIYTALHLIHCSKLSGDYHDKVSPLGKRIMDMAQDELSDIPDESTQIYVMTATLMALTKVSLGSLFEEPN